MSEKDSRRRGDLSFLNIVLCLLVVFIHVASEIVSEMPKNTLLFKTTYSFQRLSAFAAQGFFLISGVKLFLHKGEKINYFRYYTTRLFRVVIPYVLWVVIYYIYFCAEGFYDFSLGELFGYIVRGDLSAQFYFVVILVQFDLLAPLWLFVYKRGNACVHLAFSLIITVIGSQFLMPVLTTLFPAIPSLDLDTCYLRYLVYWTAGCLIGRNYTRFQEYLRSSRLSISVTFVLCGLLNVALSLATVRHTPVWLDFIHIMYCMSAILFFYMLALPFAGKAGVVLKPLSAIDKSSYLIYLMHCLVLVITNSYMTKLGITYLPERFGLRAGVVFGVCIVFAYFWQLIKYIASKIFRRA